MGMSTHRCLLVVLLTLPSRAVAASNQAIPIVLGDSTVALNGPWKFHTGDDSRWTDPAFDDSGWESVDLTPSPGATDGDVGLSGYVPGWSAKGLPGYQGYAWYRIHLTVTPPAGKTLALLGPWAVDSVYQVYGNGTLLGGVGDFTGSTPVAHGNHYPRLLAFPPESASGGAMAIAIRVWMGPWGAAAPGAGGIHIAPAVGEREAIAARYQLQWLKIFEGYAVDAVPALLFFLLAVMVLCLWPFDRTDRAFPWLAAALLLSGIQRGNQAFFFWWEIETVQGFVYFILVLTASLSLGAWMMAWRSWFKEDWPAWLPKAVAALTLILMLAQVLGRPWLFGAVFPHSAAVAVRYLITCVRLAFLLVLILIVHQGIRHRGREACYALPAVLAIGAVLFTSELVAVHVRGIWFPWGVGVSLSEYASVVFDALLFTLLVRRLWDHARHAPATAALESRA
jgi:hypothetical protein